LYSPSERNTSPRGPGALAIIAAAALQAATMLVRLRDFSAMTALVALLSVDCELTRVKALEEPKTMVALSLKATTPRLSPVFMMLMKVEASVCAGCR